MIQNSVSLKQHTRKRTHARTDKISIFQFPINPAYSPTQFNRHLTRRDRKSFFMLCIGRRKVTILWHFSGVATNFSIRNTTNAMV